MGEYQRMYILIPVALIIIFIVFLKIDTVIELMENHHLNGIITNWSKVKYNTYCIRINTEQRLLCLNFITPDERKIFEENVIIGDSFIKAPYNNLITIIKPDGTALRFLQDDFK